MGPTDAHGNTILNGGGVALGHRASAGDTSIAIGAGAHAGASAPNQECNTGAQCNYADKGGTISNPTVNNYGVAPLTVTDGQISKMSLFMVTNLKQSGPVKIIYQMDVPGGREMAYKLAQMFTSRGIDANVDAPTMIAGGCNLSVEPGITVDCISDRNTDLAQAIEKALLSAGVSKTPQITPPAPARPEMPLLLIIRKSS